MSFTSSRNVGTRDVRISAIAKAVSLLGDRAALLALTLRMAASGHSWQVGAVLIAGMLPLVVCAPLAGRWADRIDYRRLLVPAAAVQALCCLALAAAHGTVATLLLVFALGAAEAVTSAGWSALLPRLAADGDLTKAYALSQTYTSVAVIAAPALGGALTALGGTGLPLLLDAATFVVLGLVVFAVRPNPAAKTPEGAAGAGGAIAVLRADSTMAVAISGLAVMLLVICAVNVVEVFLIRSTLHAGPGWYGAVGAAWGLGVTIGAVLVGRLKSDAALPAVLVGGIGMIAAALVIVGVLPSVGWLLAPMVLGGIGNGALNVSATALTIGRAPAHVRGRVGALVNAVFAAAQLVAFTIGGVLGGLLSPRTLFVAGGLLGVLVAAVMAMLLLRRRAAEDRLVATAG
ncbi:MAG: MFS transporter [Actinomycetota bacterium]|nr:MFS transporter [Actinomycetota bacterium]